MDKWAGRWGAAALVAVASMMATAVGVQPAASAPAAGTPAAAVATIHVPADQPTIAAALDVAPEHWPLRAVTMGIGTIRAARSLVMMATGASKALAVRALVKGPEDPEWPVSFLRGHPDFELLLDGPAAAGLP